MRAKGAGIGTGVLAGVAGLALLVSCGGGGGGEKAVQAPGSLLYAVNPAVYTKGQPITANTPMVTGGAAAAFAVSPALPAGLVLNAASGVISGTPAVLAPAASYLVTVSNGGGHASVALQVTVNDVPPANLSYSAVTAVYTKGVPIAPNTPSNTGGAVVSYSIAPVLPSGLVHDPATGVISGTPSSVVPAATYTVTAVNTGGTATTNLTLAVHDIAPANLAYSTPVATYFRGVPIAANLPSSTGGAVSLYAVAPALPLGLSLNPATGVISGTPTVLTGTASYTVTASNSGGSTSADLSIRVTDTAPANLAYAANPAVYVKGTAIVPNTPSNTGGAITAYSVSPTLPAGLVLDSATGVLTGTPALTSPAASYVVTGSNSTGSATAVLVLTVKEPPPGSLTYSTNPASYTKGTAIAPNTPSNTGGAITAYSVSPALPAGLVLDSATGVLTGTPASTSPAASYVVMGSNSTGSATAVLVLTVKEPPPGSLTYSTNPASYTKGKAITPNVPANNGGPIASYGVAPALPAGLVLDPATGIISGTPTALAPAASYTVTGMGADGSPATVALTITVKDVAPSISYGSSDFTFTTGVPVSLNPTNSGGPVVTWTISPSTPPAGLSFSTSTGALTGTPTAITPTATFTITATNSGGSMSVSPSLRVNPPAPSITTQPAAATVYRGQTATFTVVASGTGPLSYQWWKNGTVLAGATSASYTTPATALADNNAAFSVVVSDTYGGSRTSSNATLTVNSAWTVTGKINPARSNPRAVLLANGKVLVAGGQLSGGGPTTVAELYDPATGLFAPTGSMNAARSKSSMTRLGSGKVLVVGGNLFISPAAETYDPSAGTWSGTGPINVQRLGHVAVLLNSGKVLLAGGYGGPTGVYLKSCELFDPASGEFSLTGNLQVEREGATASLLPDGRVMISGGSNATGYVPGAEVYDPATGLWSDAATLPMDRVGHCAVTLDSGRVLLTGGQNASGNVLTSEEFDPTSNSFSFQRVQALRRSFFAAVKLRNGRVLVTAGFAGPFGDDLRCELYDPVARAWSLAAPVNFRRMHHAAVLLQDGKVLIVGGYDTQGGTAPADAEIYE